MTGRDSKRFLTYIKSAKGHQELIELAHHVKIGDNLMRLPQSGQTAHQDRGNWIIPDDAGWTVFPNANMARINLAAFHIRRRLEPEGRRVCGSGKLGKPVRY